MRDHGESFLSRMDWLSMLSPTNKRLVWFIEESTPEMAQHMHTLEQSLAGQANVLRVGYVEALKMLPDAAARHELGAIIVFSATMLQQMRRLLSGLRLRQPYLCWVSPDLVHLAAFRFSQRLAENVIIVTRHEGETSWLRALGVNHDHVIALNAQVYPEHLAADSLDATGCLLVGVAWYNLCDALKRRVAEIMARWRARMPGRLRCLVVCLPDDEPDPADWPIEDRIVLTSEQLAAGAIPCDVWLGDPWWPDGAPGVWRAPVHIHLPPAGMHPDAWLERLQTILNHVAPTSWQVTTLWQFMYQPVWRRVLKGEHGVGGPLQPPDDPSPPAIDGELARALARLQGHTELQGVALHALAYYFWNYDYAVTAFWCRSLLSTLRETKPAQKADAIQGLNALRLHHTSAAWLLKQTLARTPHGRTQALRQGLGWRFWLRFMWRDSRVWSEWLLTLWRCGREPGVDPLGATRNLARAVLHRAGINIRRCNAPEPVPGIPILYLICHRHAELDPFLMLNVLDGNLAMVVGQRVQRWPLISRLSHASAFVVTGKERGVIIADAIAALRSHRVLALYPEVTVPSYLAEGTPLRAGILWIMQAFEKSQVIPVVLSDAFLLGAEGGQIDVWYGKPIVCDQSVTAHVLNQVRQFYHQHLPQTQMLTHPPRLG